MEHQQDPLCDYAWLFSLDERAALLESGVSAWVIESVEHFCDLDDGHDGTHVCSCGVSS